MKKLFTLMSLLFCLTVIAQDKIYIHTATADNSSGNVTFIDHPDLNNNPNAGIVYAHVWNPGGGVGGVYNNNVTGLWYSSGVDKWAIFNEDEEDIVEGSSYNIYIADPANVITHISTPDNMGTFGNYTTVIDDSRFNGLNPGPYAIMSNYWNPNSVYNNLVYGFYFDIDLNKRGIFHENVGPIPTGAAFKILITGTAGVTRFTHTASAENSSGDFTIIDHPSLNDNPDATFVISHYWGVNGTETQVAIDKVLGIWYTGSNWSIYTENIADSIPAGMAFDIIVAPQTTVGIQEIALEARVDIQPNPTKDFVTISTIDVISDITLYNNLGREVLYIKGEGNSMKVDLSGLSLGVYLAKVRVDDAVKTVKLIKQ